MIRGILGLCLIAALSIHAETHVVRKGDTLSAIAKKHGISTRDLMAANHITDPKHLQIDQVLVIPDPSAPEEYTVQSGDTLDSIARKHGTTIRALAEYNQLDRPDRLSVGQVLKIPADRLSDSASLSTRKHPPLPSSVLRELNRIPTRRGNWKYIVIHHSASASGTVKGMDRYHREERRMQNGLAYHFVIGNGHGMRDGEIAVGDRWRRQIQGGHLASEPLNRIAIGICLVGNFETATPSAAQLQSLEALLADLLQRTGNQPSAIRTHRSINNRPTRCPGRRFPIALIQEKFS